MLNSVHKHCPGLVARLQLNSWGGETIFSSMTVDVSYVVTYEEADDHRLARV